MIHLEVIVPDVDDVLAAQAYGPGALLRWEKASSINGVYTEGGTVALVAGQTVYDVWDATGTLGTWYRTRISNAAASSFSTYTIGFQSAEQGLYLSVSQLRGFDLGGGLEDEQLLTLLDAATQDIRRVAGPMGPVTEMHHPHGDMVLLQQEPLSITEVREGYPFGTPVILSTDDYTVVGSVLYRIRTGSHPGTQWRGRVWITHQPQDDLASRQRVQLGLVKLDLTYSPGMAQQTIGTYSESFAAGQGSLTYQEEREQILASLNSGVSIR